MGRRDPERPVAVVDVVCSAGTYVRALARDLGESLGSAGYLGALVRTSSGPFDLEPPSRWTRFAPPQRIPAGLLPLMLPIDAGLEDFPEIVLTAEETQQVARGQFVEAVRRSAGPAERYRLRGPDGTLVAIASPSGGNRLAPDKVFVSPASAAATPAPDRDGDARRRGRRCPHGTWVPHSWSSACSTASIWAICTCCIWWTRRLPVAPSRPSSPSTTTPTRS